MPTYTLQDSKFVSETVSIVQDFSDLLVSEEVIVGTPTITITLLTGIDSNPNNLLYMGITTTTNTVEQRFRLGVPGCIYSIVYTVVTSFPHTYEKETFLAVLPLEGSANPQFTALLETSCFYPYEVSDQLQGSQLLLSGRLAQTFYTYFEGLKGSQLLSSGVLTLVVIYYNEGPDGLQGSQILIGGTLTYQSFIPYNYDHEDLKSIQILISGTLVAGTLITYSYEVDSLQGSQLLLSGTLS